MKRLLPLLTALILFSSCGSKQQQSSINEPQQEPKAKQDISAIAALRADSILSSLSLEEKVGQLFMPAIKSNTKPSNIELLDNYINNLHIGGIVLEKGDTASAKKLAEICRAAKIPLFVAIDAEWGLGMKLIDAPSYPKNGNLSIETEESELFDYGRQVAQDSHDVGVNMILGPVLDVASSSGGVMGKRSFGSDPKRVSDLGVAYAKGLESGGVISAAKHFPGHGNALNDSHLAMAKVMRDRQALDSIDLRPFRQYINSGLSAIMAGHIQVPALDSIGLPASVSKQMLTSLLRDEMNFNGLILTDALNMAGIRGFSASDAIKAGADLILCPADFQKEYAQVVDDVNSGNLDISIINDRCKRILFYKVLFNVI